VCHQIDEKTPQDECASYLIPQYIQYRKEKKKNTIILPKGWINKKNKQNKQKRSQQQQQTIKNIKNHISLPVK